MKKYLLWSFERGSFHYDIICGIILAFILFTPVRIFPDRPDFMRYWLGPDVRQAHDDDDMPVYTVRLQTPVFSSNEVNIQAALQSLHDALKKPVQPSRMEPIYDTYGALVAYAIWP
jgi:hypothetical protein